MPAEPAGSGETDGVLPPAEPAAEPAEEPPAAEEPFIPKEPPMLDDPLMAGEPAPLPAMEEEGLTFRLRQPAAARQRASARQRERNTAVKRFIQKRSFFLWFAVLRF